MFSQLLLLQINLQPQASDWVTDCFRCIRENDPILGAAMFNTTWYTDANSIEKMVKNVPL